MAEYFYLEVVIQFLHSEVFFFFFTDSNFEHISVAFLSLL